MRLRDRVAVVTGTSRGIGQEFCVALAREGAKVVAVDLLPCGDTVEQGKQVGVEVVDVAADVSDAQATLAMAAQTLERFGRIDVLVNNAALLRQFSPFDLISDDDWDRVMAVNVKGMWLCAKAVVPAMRQQGRGRIINMSSDTIWGGTPMILHYVASKGAVFSFTRALARELAGTGINVNAITPGFTVTEGVASMGHSEIIDHISAVVLEQQIVKRAATPSDLTGALVFLASDESDFITGQTLNVNGGAAHH